MFSINAASSIINKDTASDLPASPAAETALTCDPLVNLNVNLLFSSCGTLNHDGKLSYMNFTLVTMFLAVSCLVAKQSTFLSLWKVINHKEYPAANVDIPNCLDFSTIEYGLSFHKFNTLS